MPPGEKGKKGEFCPRCYKPGNKPHAHGHPKGADYDESDYDRHLHDYGGIKFVTKHNRCPATVPTNKITTIRDNPQIQCRNSYKKEVLS